MIKKDLGLLAKVVGRDFGIEVIEVPNATTFSVNARKQVFIPSFAGDEDEEAILRGGIAHEVPGHILHTDFKALEVWLKEKSGDALASALQNIIEDIRIEKAAARVFPGVRKILGGMVVALHKRNFFALPTTPHPAGVLCAFLLHTLRGQELGQSFDVAPSSKMMEQIFGAQLSHDIIEIARAGSRGKTTSDVLSAADRILDLLKMTSTSRPESKPEPKAGKKGKGNKGKGTATQPGNGSPGEPGEPGGTENAGKGSGDVEHLGESTLETTPTQAVKDAAEKALTARASDIGTTDMGEMAAKAIETAIGGGRCPPICTAVSRNMADSSNASFTPDVLAASLSMRLRSRLQELLQSRAEDEDYSLTDRGRLIMRRAVKAFVGDRYLFEEEGDEGEGLNTAVHILVDASGSMGGWEASNALAVIYALSSALSQYERQGVSFALSAFNNNVLDFKSFSAPWPSAKNALWRYRAAGGTRFTGAVRAVLPDLMARKERRKVLFAITDGDTGLEESNQSVAASAKACGVEIRVLLIGQCGDHDEFARSNGFHSAASVLEGGDLQKAILSTLKACV